MHKWSWDEMKDDCGFWENEDNPTIPTTTEYTGWFIIEEPDCYHDPSCFYHTHNYSPSTSISFAGEVRADNEEPDPYDFETYVGEAAVSFSADLQNPDIICGPYILTGWQAAREIEGLISDPGDSVFHYGLPWPETVEEYIELLRTDWADNMYVFAGGADPGGSLFPYTPLDLDIYSEPFACPPMVVAAYGFLLMRDYYPYGVLPGDVGYGDETIPWPDSMSYPLGYPIDGNAWHEEQYALWPIDCFINAICNDPPNLSMRVRVTDHVGNWKRSGMIEDMGLGVAGKDPGIDIVKFEFVSYNLDAIRTFCNDNKYIDPVTHKQSVIYQRSLEGETEERIVVAAIGQPKSKDAPVPQTIDVTFSVTEAPAQGTNTEVDWQLRLANQGEITDLALIMPYSSPNGCPFYYYILEGYNEPNGFKVSDSSTGPNFIFLSSDDYKFDGYSFEGNAKDHSILAGIESESPNPQLFRAQSAGFKFGNRRGLGYQCDEDVTFILQNAEWRRAKEIFLQGGLEKLTCTFYQEGKKEADKMKPSIPVTL